VLSFSDEQLGMIADACRPLDAFVRTAFVEAVAAYFPNRAELGNGELARCLSLQLEFRAPPRSMRQARSPTSGGTRACTHKLGPFVSAF
jgi:hypothetical protein